MKYRLRCLEKLTVRSNIPCTVVTTTLLVWKKRATWDDVVWQNLGKADQDTSGSGPGQHGNSRAVWKLASGSA